MSEAFTTFGWVIRLSQADDSNFATGPASPAWALAYGVATTVASYFFVLPSMGMGVFGRRSPEGLRTPLSSLANHLFYGVGLAVGIALA